MFFDSTPPDIRPGLALGAVTTTDDAPGEVPIAQRGLPSLVGRARLGDAVAQSELVRRYQRRVFGFVHNLIRQRSAVEDIVQTVMIRMIRRLPLLRDPNVFESWLFRMARNEVLDINRRARCRVTLVGADSHRDAASECDEHGRFEVTEAVHHAIDCLPHPEREIILLVIAGHDYRTIADRLGISPGAVKLRIFRLRQLLRPRILEALGQGSDRANDVHATITSTRAKRARVTAAGRTRACHVGSGGTRPVARRGPSRQNSRRRVTLARRVPR